MQSHPRLGAAKVDSAQSRAEQASLGSGSGAAAEGEKLRVLNEEYEAAFPGLRYVVFVNGRSREAVMQDMRRRIARRDLHEERKEGVEVSFDFTEKCLVSACADVDRLCVISPLTERGK